MNPNEKKSFLVYIGLSAVTIFVIILIVVSATVYVMSKRNGAKAEEQVSEEMVTSNDPTVLVKRVSRHMLLPQSEIPQIVQLSGVEKLKASQPFFEHAKDGDRLLVYSKRVILFDPVGDRIIEVAYIRPDVAGSSTQEASVSAQTIEPIGRVP